MPVEPRYQTVKPSDDLGTLAWPVATDPTYTNIPTSHWFEGTGCNPSSTSTWWAD